MWGFIPLTRRNSILPIHFFADVALPTPSGYRPTGDGITASPSAFPTSGLAGGIDGFVGYVLPSNRSSASYPG